MEDSILLCTFVILTKSSLFTFKNNLLGTSQFKHMNLDAHAVGILNSHQKDVLNHLTK